MHLTPIFVTDREGHTHELAAMAGKSLMEVICDAGLPISAVCRGCLSCATCHVYVAASPGQIPPPTDDELLLLESTSSHDPQRSRLACQIKMGPHCADLAVTLAPED